MIGVKELSGAFNEHYGNIAENTSGKKPTHVAHDNNIFDADRGIELIKQFFLDPSSISTAQQNSSIQCFP